MTTRHHGLTSSLVWNVKVRGFRFLWPGPDLETFWWTWHKNGKTCLLLESGIEILKINSSKQVSILMVSPLILFEKPGSKLNFIDKWSILIYCKTWYLHNFQFQLVVKLHTLTLLWNQTLFLSWTWRFLNLKKIVKKNQNYKYQNLKSQSQIIKTFL